MILVRLANAYTKAQAARNAITTGRLPILAMNDDPAQVKRECASENREAEKGTGAPTAPASAEHRHADTGAPARPDGGRAAPGEVVSHSNTYRKRLHEALESRLGYEFHNRELRSARLRIVRGWRAARSRKPRQQDNEQLELLGDAVLGFVASEALVLRHPNATEGQLSVWKAHLVAPPIYTSVRWCWGSGSSFFLARAKTATAVVNGARFLADALEALIAALFLMAAWKLRAPSSKTTSCFSSRATLTSSR